MNTMLTRDYVQRAQAKYKNSPRGKYIAHKINAKQCGIEFDISFEDWWNEWQKIPGAWENRGNTNLHHVMRRIGDTGPIKKGNVFVTLKQRSFT